MCQIDRNIFLTVKTHCVISFLDTSNNDTISKPFKWLSFPKTEVLVIFHMLSKKKTHLTRFVKLS